MTDHELSGDDAWVFLERGPTKNVGYVVGFFFLMLPLLGIASRAYNGLPPLAFMSLAGTVEYISLTVVVTALSLVWTKSWVLKYSIHQIVLQESFLGFKRTRLYLVSEIVEIRSFFARSATAFGIPFDTILLKFDQKNLDLQLGDWKHHSLKQFVCDLMSYRNDLPRDLILLAYIAGQYDRQFAIGDED